MHKIFLWTHDHPFIFVFSIAIIIRIIALMIFPLLNPYGGDFEFYHQAAILLKNGNGFLDIFLAPGLPIFLVFFYTIFGISLAVSVGIQILLGALIAIVITTLGLIFFSPRIAYIAGIITAVWPNFLIQMFDLNQRGLLLYTFILLLGILFLSKAFLEHKILFGAFAGVLFAFAALVDPVGTYVPIIILFLFMLVVIYGKHTLNLSFSSTQYKAMVLCMFFSLLVFIPWMWRNYTILQSQNHGGNTKEIVSIVSKKEIEVLHISKIKEMLSIVSSNNLAVLRNGMVRMFLLPDNLSALHQYASFSYKEFFVELIHGNYHSISIKEIGIFSLKILFTGMHLLLLFFGILGIIIAKQKKLIFGLGVLGVLGYTTIAAIGFGSLFNDNFASISPLSEFAFPFLPIFILFSVYFITNNIKGLNFK